MTEVSMNFKKFGLKKACAWALAAGLCLTMLPVGAGIVEGSTISAVKATQTQADALTKDQTPSNAPTKDQTPSNAPTKDQTEGNAQEDKCKEHKYVETVKKATPTKNGSITKKCSVCGDVVTETIAKVNKTKLSKTSCTYSGSLKKPTVKVIDADGAVIAKTEYTVKFKNNRKVGTASAVITFNEDSEEYTGEIVKTFKINPVATTISKIATTYQGFKVTWDKQATQTTGYEIRYSTKSNMASAQKITVTKNSVTAKTVKNLTANKKYYVQVRTYKTIDGTKYYSAWSAKKSVTTLR